MQALSVDYSVQDFSPSVQQILPTLDTFDDLEIAFLINYLSARQLNKQTKVQAEKTIAEKRYGRHRGQIKMLAGFDDDLGDDFWLGNDK